MTETSIENCVDYNSVAFGHALRDRKLQFWNPPEHPPARTDYLHAWRYGDPEHKRTIKPPPIFKPRHTAARRKYEYDDGTKAE